MGELLIVAWLGVSGCGSPTEFELARDVSLDVDDAVAVLSPNGSIRISFAVDISNRGSMAVSYVEECLSGSLQRTGALPLEYSNPCISGLPTVSVEPGRTVSAAVEMRFNDDDWAGQIDGTYTLSLMLFVEGRSRAEAAESEPFQIVHDD